ncbi:MAG: hypothetical protein NVS9B15_03480 [Acidobacteriaceae bacterium]
MPGEFIYTAGNQPSADQITQLAFQFARSEAALGVANGPEPSPAPSGGNSTDMAKLEQEAQDKIVSIQKEIDALQNAPAKTRAEREAQSVHLQELQSELAFAQTRLATLKTFSGFVRQTVARNSGVRSFSDQIDQLARSSGISLPSTAAARSKSAADSDSAPTTPASSQAAQTQAQAAANAQAVHQQSSGIVGMIEDAVTLGRKSHEIESLINDTLSLQATIRRLRDPLVAELQRTVQQGGVVESAADNADPSTLAEEAKQLDQYTLRFKALSAAVIPLGEQSILLDTQIQSLEQWQSFVRATDAQVLRRIGIQTGIVLVAISILLGFAELWKRATFRYIHDYRRRTQFLLLRRIVLGLVITFIVAFALVTQAGSLATYAGFLTAGLAVALQSVILSVFAYFFLIGRYGVHVGDRITVNGVTGDVFDIGLIRLHLIEVSGNDGDQHATGRSVVFSNSVILQPGTSLYKQLPGSDFVWHEVRLTMSPNDDVQRIEQQLLAAVVRIFDTYCKDLRLDTLTIGQHIRFEQLKPTTRLRLTDAGLEIIIRYPVSLANAADIDDRITRTLLDTIAKEPDVRLVPSTAPNLQPTEKHPSAAA